MLKNMKWFRGSADVDDMRKAIDALKAAEQALADAYVGNSSRHAWTKGVPVRLNMAYKLRATHERITKQRMEMQEDDFQFRTYHGLPTPPDGYD